MVREIDAAKHEDVAPDTTQLQFAQLAVGGFHACALDTTGTVRCWGSNELGQLGIAPGEDRRRPIVVPGLASVVRIAAGSFHSCAIGKDEKVRCWGRNDEGLLGDGTFENRIGPVEVVDLEHVKRVSAGGYHSCAVVEDFGKRNLKCWGANDFGQLGRSTPRTSPRPVAVSPTTLDVKDVACGDQHTCVVGNHDVRCFGWNTHGQLGDGTTASSTTPSAIPLFDVLHLSAGIFQTCVSFVGGAVKCWGENVLGQLGDGTMTPRLVPVPTKIEHVEAISARSHHGCAVVADGTVRCWGLGSSGQLGEDAMMSRTLPVLVKDLTDTREVAVGGHTSCAISRGRHAVHCWGANDHGQLGDGTSVPRRLTPVPVVW